MPVTIKTGPLRFKDPSSGQYVGIDVIAERKTSEQIAEIENVGAEALEEIGSAKEEAVEEIREIVEDIGAMTIHICTAQEYDAHTGIPTIANPDATTFYLVPGGDAPNLYIEWIYTNNAWEQFGSASIDLSNYVQKADYATASAVGVVMAGDGLQMSSARNGKIMLAPASSAQIKSGVKVNVTNDISRQHEAAFYGIAKAAGSDEKNSTLPVGQYTESAKSAISEMLSGSVSVSGTTPSITALPGIQYVCGEVATLDITLPASGCVDVVFESGSAPTVLTITPPTGVTVKWANGFDPTALDANVSYSIRVINGEYGIATAYGLDDGGSQKKKLIYTWNAPYNYEKRTPLEVDLTNNRIRLDDVSGIPDTYGSRYQCPAYIDFDPISSSSTPGSLPIIGTQAVFSIKKSEDNWVTLSINDSTDSEFQSTCKLDGWYLWIKTGNNAAVENGSLRNLDTTHKYVIDGFATLGSENFGLNVYMQQGAYSKRIRGVDSNSLGEYNYETIGLRGNTQIMSSRMSNNIKITGSLSYQHDVWMLETVISCLNPNNSTNTARYVAKQISLITAFNNFDGFDKMQIYFGNYMPQAYGSYLKVYDIGES